MVVDQYYYLINNYYISDILSLNTSVTIINTQLIKEIKTNKQLEETLTSYNKNNKEHLDVEHS